MTLNPSQDLKVMLPQVLAILKQAAQDPESIDIDMGDAQQVKDALSNIINAKQQEGEGGGKQEKSKSAKASSGEEEEDDDEKKNRSGQ